jgi:hypothetical protein
MAVGIKVGAGVRLLGDGAFVTALFCTIAGNLEPSGWGTRFPIVMGPLYEGRVPAERVSLARRELGEISAELSESSGQDAVLKPIGPLGRSVRDA